MPLMLLSCFILAACIGAEVAVLFLGTPAGVADVTVGRVLGTLDAIAVVVVSYHYGSSASSARKTELMAPPAEGAPPPP